MGVRTYHVTTPAVSDTEFAVAHRLGRVPVGVLMVKANKNCFIGFSDERASTKDYAFLKCSVGDVTATLQFL